MDMCPTKVHSDLKGIQLKKQSPLERTHSSRKGPTYLGTESPVIVLGETRRHELRTSMSF